MLPGMSRWWGCYQPKGERSENLAQMWWMDEPTYASWG